MRKRIALLYDFDYTLTDKFMQQYGLMQDLGYTDETVGDFFTACEDAFGDADIDMCLSLMGGILFMAKDKGRKVSKEYLKSFGKDIGWGFGLLFLSFIFSLILAFGDSEYVGPNGK